VSAGLQVSRLGEAALLADVPAPFDLALQRRVWALARQAQGWPGVVRVLPGIGNLMVGFDADRLAGDALAERLIRAWPGCEPLVTEQRSLELPIRYGGESGQDLDELADRLGLARRELIDRHLHDDYFVAAIGAMPGHPYLVGASAGFAVPRRDTPRMRVPAGSVGVAVGMSVIVPFDAPCGWSIIGRTRVRLFDVASDPPALLRPGDRVRFVEDKGAG
jgi:5-oxoprolinase (ATP-hydrolysing) subunit B